MLSSKFPFTAFSQRYPGPFTRISPKLVCRMTSFFWLTKKRLSFVPALRELAIRGKLFERPVEGGITDVSAMQTITLLGIENCAVFFCPFAVESTNALISSDT